MIIQIDTAKIRTAQSETRNLQLRNRNEYENTDDKGYRSSLDEAFNFHAGQLAAYSEMLEGRFEPVEKESSLIPKRRRRSK